MKLSEEKIKQAILHPELPIRKMAFDYFSMSFSQDATIMPVVVQSIEMYGRKESSRLINNADNLPQTEETIQWCMEELKQDLNDQDETMLNFRYASALSGIIANADPSLIVSKELEIYDLPYFTSEMSITLAERIHLLSDDNESLWNQLTGFCEHENDKQYIYDMDLPHAYRLVETLSRGGNIVADKVLEMLAEEVDFTFDGPRALMRGFVIRLAGELRLLAAVPVLIKLLIKDYDWFNQESLWALKKMGGEQVLESLFNEFPTSNKYFRVYASEVLESIHTKQCVQKCIELFNVEEGHDAKIFLGRAALMQFSTEAIEPVREFILTSEVDPEIISLRECLVSVSTLSGVDFPEHEEWKKENEEARRLCDQRIAELDRVFRESPTEYEDDLDEEIDIFNDDELIKPTYSPDTIIRQEAKIGRNAPCPCGSEKKYKKCYLNKANGNRLFN